ncbi:MAG: BMP family ABC transporter substrate-binding protein [Smithella sp.]
MKIKKIFTFVIVLCVSVVSLAAWSSKPADAAAANSDEKTEVYILIKNRGDLSYWDSMAGGGDRAAQDFADKANIHVIETTADVTANLDAMYEAADNGANLIITASDYKDNLVKISNEYPEISCAIVGEDLRSRSDKIYGINFKTSDASFLAGIVAADVASSNLEGASGNKTVGFIGGMDETLVIQEYFMGYIQGAKFYDPSIKIVSNYVGAWNDPDTAKTQALTQYNDAKADIIFAAAGGSGNGVHTAAAEAGKYVIGVDSNQALMYANDPDIQKRFVTSVIKEIGNAVYRTIDSYLADGTFPYGEYQILGMKDDTVSIVEDETLDTFLSEKGKEKLEEAKDKITSGEIIVESALDKDQDTIKKFIEENTK